MNTITDDYIISGGEAGKNRLNVLSEVLAEYEEALLNRLGLANGMSFLDMGSGGGNVAMLAAKIVGASGSVTALDFDKEIISLAQQDAADKGLHNTSFQAMSVYDMAFDNEFDITYARFLLSHLKRPLDVLQNMKRSVKQGGKIIVEDVHFSGHFSYPASEAFDNYVHYYTAAAKFKGEDANIGPSLPFLFERAGIKEVGFDTIQPCFINRPGKLMALLTLSNIKETLLAQGIAGLPEINAMLRHLEAFTNDPQTIISLPRIFRVWGIKR